MYQANRRLRFIVLCLALLVSYASHAADRPNIVFILADDLGLTDLACTGSDYYFTPNLDSFAAQSMMFVNGYSNCSNCAPTRAALMSGMYAPRTGVYTVSRSDRGAAKNRALIPATNKTELAPEIVTLAETLKGAGYTTAMVGKWHLGDNECAPQNQGFEHVPFYAHGTASFYAPYGKDKRLPQDAPEGEYLTDRVTREAIGFLKTQKDAEKPFFLYLPLFAVHTPINPQHDFMKKVSARQKGEHHTHSQYAGFVEGMDYYIGNVLHAIHELGMDDNTIVVFTSDNGGNGSVTDQHPLRGSKGMFYEGGIRVPLFVRYPGVTTPKAACFEPVMLMDFYPTFAQLAGAQLPKDQPIDGLSLLPLMKDPQARLERDAIYFHFPAYLELYPGKEMQEAHKQPWRATPCSVIRTRTHKLIEYFEDDSVELFDLTGVPDELKDISKEQPEIAKELLDKLKAWQQATNAPVPTERNPLYQPE